MRRIYRYFRRIYYSISYNILFYYQILKSKILSKKYCINIKEKRKEKIIVSLTSIPSRFDKLYLCLETIMGQTMKPDKIILYLGIGVQEKELPKEIIRMKKRGLTIEYREDKYLRPHTKYFYAMQEYPNDIIITFDDDILYNRNIIKKLYKSYVKHPTAVSCIRAHKIIFDEHGQIEKYINWKFEYTGKDALLPNHYLCATGVGGVLYPPRCMNDETFDINKINELSLNTDDLWLKVMELKYRVKVVKAIRKNYHLYEIKGTQGIALKSENVYTNNDISMKKLINYYDINKEDFSQ